MESLATLAGFYAAHGIYCVAEGETMAPLLGSVKTGTTRDVGRLEIQDLEEAVKAGLKWLEDNPDGVRQAVLVYDGYITLPGGRMDALIVEAREYGEQPAGFSMAIPYRNASDPKGFAVHRPKFVDLDNNDQDHVMALSTAFFKGVNQHPRAATVWNRHLDDSL